MCNFGDCLKCSNPDCFDERLDKMHEECGVFGVYSLDGNEVDVAGLTYYGLYALQHRGQESAGIAVSDRETIVFHKDMGLVPEIFDKVMLNHLKGTMSVGHVRYSTTGASRRENAQPIVVRSRNGQLALAHNGNIVNASMLREQMEENGTIFQTTNDTEVLINLITKHSITSETLEEAVEKMMVDVKGSYGLILMTASKMLGVRDPYGIRPLCIGKTAGAYVLASESCALDAVNAEFIRDVEPGEIVIIENDEIRSVRPFNKKDTKLCIFEFVYFARPDSVIDCASVQQSRYEAGKRLAIEHPVEADVVIGVPDSGISAAIGFSNQTGIPYGEGLVKNRYVGRTFIQPSQGMREVAVRIKHNAIKKSVEGKRVVIIDDSIVRGTTTRRIVQVLKKAGAKEVHMRVSSPPIKFPCYFGIDISSRKELVADKLSVEEIREMICADTLGYLSLEGLLKTPIGSKRGFCSACLDGNYPIEVPEEGDKFSCGC
ncbi:amidophosphoribosyltransferase [Ruminiclostridium papyrosolvens DSM 2782]|uniref:Amidophosphoribosyltransferase n=1 Tax=Ruminiclostridium papyrosolvens DSM 2782 TaxID=588581 RepID=F1TH74_9FIRM|nr:amidophosphoribosyltransferase [Ruminiclostridium papyrosolvens]EGD46314.1 amidophosphoribosyltransferase [Ruminiclostridium papyrosolvens DSM 2782]WES32966.1 amidophosphoribosyltransferase [Ruminiclostridium papyrosolvens DSM 2782]